MNNYPDGSNIKSAPWNEKDNCCPVCGGKILEFIYSFECEDCSWSEEKDFEND